MYVTDGYGNCRVHRFNAEGNLIQSWSELGSGPGQFNVPHGVFLDAMGRVFVADRENNRIQLFTRDGAFIEQWTDMVRPTNVYIDVDDNVFVAEEGNQAGLFPWMTPAKGTGAIGGRVSVFDRAGTLLSRWGGGKEPCSPVDFFAPHDIWLDSHGSIYVGEVTWAAGGNAGVVPKDCPCLRKFERVHI